MGQVVQKGESWIWQRPGSADVALSHNRWGNTSAKQDFRTLESNLAQLDQCIATGKAALVKKYHEIWRDSWSHGFDFDLTSAEFSEKLVFEGIGYPSGQFLHSHFDLSFDDSGLFYGHGFLAVFKRDGTLDHVEMFG